MFPNSDEIVFYFFVDFLEYSGKILPQFNFQIKSYDIFLLVSNSF